VGIVDADHTAAWRQLRDIVTPTARRVQNRRLTNYLRHAHGPGGLDGDP
jgi:hypothetical protein